MTTRTERNLEELRGQIADQTGFENGAKFATAEAVREYFTSANMDEMFGADAPTLAERELDRMAAAVIENRWHCEF